MCVCLFECVCFVKHSSPRDTVPLKINSGTSGERALMEDALGMSVDKPHLATNSSSGTACGQGSCAFSKLIVLRLFS